jgi:CDP-6-deoxy-D-xylo-4-hexulose-3-dehydrase
MNWKLMENSITFIDKLKLIFFILSTDRYTNGNKVRELEKLWCDWLGCKYSLFVSSGSTANLLLISSIKELYNLKDGDKVLVPSCTWMTNVAPIIQLGLTPVFSDIQFSDFSFDIKELYHIKNKHPDIKLIFISHLLGFTSDCANTKVLAELFPEALVIDDVCESHGCKDILGNKIGSNSLGATFSTYFGHHLTSVEGGFVCTNNIELYDLMKMKRSHGLARESIYYDKYMALYPELDKNFLFVTDGYNFRNTEIHAVLGISQLKKLDSYITIRNNNYKLFCDLTEKYKPFMYTFSYDENVSNFSFPIIFKSDSIKYKLEDILSKYNIEYRPIISGNLLKHPFLNNYNLCSDKIIPNIDIIHNNGLYIGNSQFVNKHNIIILDNILNSILK